MDIYSCDSLHIALQGVGVNEIIYPSIHPVTYMFIMGGVFAGIKPTFTVILPEQ